LKDITLGQYFPGHSAIHQLDPRAKLCLSLVIMASLFSRNNWSVLAVWSGVFMFALLQSKIPATIILRNLRPFRWLFAITIVLNIIYGPASNNNLEIGWRLAIDSGRLNFAVFNSVRLVLFIMYSSLLTLTTSPLDITDALDKIFKPFRRIGFPVHEFTMMISIAIRFIPTILHEADRIRKAQISRGVDFSGSLAKRIKALIPITLPLFLSTFQRAEELATAMEARCYDTTVLRTQFKQLAWKRLDTVIMLSGTAAAAILASL
ncbi:MAG: energy-coupling factor transporter transmembrane component T family protein, partial [bacterium]